MMTQTQNKPFPLSQKYLDFLRYVASAEFLEGTTSAGKQLWQFLNLCLEYLITREQNQALFLG